MDYIEQIVDIIIRPTRHTYHTKSLGDPSIRFTSKRGKQICAERQDRIILSKCNHPLHLSFYKISNQNQGVQRNVFHSKKSCIIFLHANNGSRIQGKQYLEQMLGTQTNVCLFDCSGSGSSGGKYVTLGLRQSRDLDTVVNFLVKEKNISQIFLWGRSMGASTALIYASRNHAAQVKGLILDSPFQDLQRLVRQIASQRSGLPMMLFQPLIPLVRSRMQQKTGYSTKDLKIKKYFKSTFTKENKQIKSPLASIPALFLVSKIDKLVKKDHGEKLYQKYPCKQKILSYIDVQHHQSRQSLIINRCINFIEECLGINEQLNSVKAKKLNLGFHKNSYPHQKPQSQNSYIQRRYNTECQTSNHSSFQVNLKNNLDEDQYNRQNTQQTERISTTERTSNKEQNKVSCLQRSYQNAQQRRLSVQNSRIRISFNNVFDNEFINNTVHTIDHHKQTNQHSLVQNNYNYAQKHVVFNKKDSVLGQEQAKQSLQKKQRNGNSKNGKSSKGKQFKRKISLSKQIRKKLIADKAPNESSVYNFVETNSQQYVHQSIRSTLCMPQNIVFEKKKEICEIPNQQMVTFRCQRQNSLPENNPVRRFNEAQQPKRFVPNNNGNNLQNTSMLTESAAFRSEIDHQPNQNPRYSLNLIKEQSGGRIANSHHNISFNNNPYSKNPPLFMRSQSRVNLLVRKQQSFPYFRSFNTRSTFTF